MGALLAGGTDEKRLAGLALAAAEMRKAAAADGAAGAEVLREVHRGLRGTRFLERMLHTAATAGGGDPERRQQQFALQGLALAVTAGICREPAIAAELCSAAFVRQLLRALAACAAFELEAQRVDVLEILLWMCGSEDGRATVGAEGALFKCCSALQSETSGYAVLLMLQLMAVLARDPAHFWAPRSPEADGVKRGALSLLGRALAGRLEGLTSGEDVTADVQLRALEFLCAAYPFLHEWEESALELDLGKLDLDRSPETGEVAVDAGLLLGSFAERLPPSTASLYDGLCAIGTSKLDGRYRLKTLQLAASIVAAAGPHWLQGAVGGRPSPNLLDILVRLVKVEGSLLLSDALSPDAPVGGEGGGGGARTAGDRSAEHLPHCYVVAEAIIFALCADEPDLSDSAGRVLLEVHEFVGTILEFLKTVEDPASAPPGVVVASFRLLGCYLSQNPDVYHKELEGALARYCGRALAGAHGAPAFELLAPFFVQVAEKGAWRTFLERHLQVLGVAIERAAEAEHGRAEPLLEVASLTCGCLTIDDRRGAVPIQGPLAQLCKRVAARGEAAPLGALVNAAELAAVILMQREGHDEHGLGAAAAGLAFRAMDEVERLAGSEPEVLELELAGKTHRIHFALTAMMHLAHQSQAMAQRFAATLPAFDPMKETSSKAVLVRCKDLLVVLQRCAEGG